MKIKIKVLTALLATAALFSCGDKWLGSIGPQDGNLDPNIIFQTEENVSIAFTGTYNLIKEYYGGTHDKAGYKAFQIGLCYAGSDLINGAGFFSDENNPITLTTDTSQTGANTSFAWKMFYQVVNNCNAIVAKIKISKFSDEFKKSAIAEAEALRGWAFFQLARLYQECYVNVATPDNTLCIPLYTEPTSTSTQGQARASVTKTYEQILKDLSDENIDAIPGSQSQYYRANKNVVYAWRAQVYLEMGKYDLAAADAKKAYDGYPLMDAETFNKGFNKFNGEWIWGCPFQDDQANGYASFFSFADMVLPEETSGYQVFFVNNTFVARFSDTDCRNQFFYFYGEPRPTKYNNWASSKFQSLPNSFFNGDYVYIRSAEMMLIEAEGLARSGNEPQAANVLFALQSARDPKAVKSGNTGQALIDEILIERRKELWGESPVEYFDAKRLKLPIAKGGNAPAPASVPADSPSFIYQIPQSEMDNNPLMEQNKR